MGAISFARRAFLGSIFGLLALASAGPAFADRDAESFAQGLIDKGVGILRNTGDPMRRTKFREFMLTYADARKTALYTLGNYRRGANDADIEAFVKAFTDFATAVYESRLDQYKGQTLKVVGSIENHPGDVTVNMVVVDQSAPSPLRVAFRLEGSNSNYKFFDVQVEGIWLSVSQRDDFAAFLSKNNGNVSALSAHLNSQTQQMMAGAAH